MSSTSPRQGLSKTLRSIKARFIVVSSLVLLAAVFSASALTANMTGPIGQQAGSFTANVFSLFSGSQAAVDGNPFAATAAEYAGGGKSESTFAEEALAPVPGSLWFNGDADGNNGLANGQSTSNPARVYSDFIVPAGPGWAVTGLYSRNLMNFTGVTQANYEIRTGVSNGNGGTVVFTGTGAATQVATGNNFFGFPEYSIQMSGLNLTVPPGTYWLSVAPISPTPGSGSSFVSTTSGANAVGTPPGNNGNEFFNSAFFTTNFGPTQTQCTNCVDHAQGVVGTVAGPLVCAAPPANMVAWYPGEINTNDIIGNPPNNGVFQGTASYTTGTVGNAFNFTGSNNVQVPPSAAMNVGAAGGISVDAWIRPTTLTQAAIVEWERTPGSNTVGAHFFHSVAQPGGLYVNLVDTAGVDHIFRTVNPVLTAGTPAHVAFTYVKATGAVAIYVNGAAQVLTTNNVGTGFTPATGGNFYIGRRTTGTDFFTGVVDEVEVFSRGLTGAEVASIAAAGSAGKCHTSQIQFSTAAQTVSESAGTVLVTVTRTGANDTTASVDFFTQNGTATGGPAGCPAGADYTTVSIPTITFAPGERTQTVNVPICDDAIDEPNETFTANMTQVTGTGASLGTPSVQTITITDNDAGAAFTASSSSVTEPNTGQVNLVVTVTKTGATAFDETVTYTTGAPQTATPGTSCAAGVDYITTAGTLTFLAGGPSSQTVNVPVCGDTVIESDETFTFDLLTASGGGTLTDGTETILENDSTVQFSSATYSFTEGTSPGPGLTPVNITVTRTGTGTGLPAATVDAATIQFGGTATGSNSCAIAGTDYIIVSGQTLTWAAGDTTPKNFVVNLCADSVDELNEIFNVQLSNPIGTALGTPSTAVVTILDDDGAPTYALVCSPTSIPEGSATTCTVTRTGATQIEGVTVAWTTAPGTATAGDYTPTSGTVTFAAGDTSRTFTVTAVADTLFEPSEQFTISLAATASDGGTTSGSPQTITITNAGTSAPTFAINDVTQVEGNAGQTAFIFTITRTGDAQAPNTVTFHTADGGGAFVATAPSDYTAIPSDTVTFTQGQTTRQLAVIVNGDTVFENTETFSVILDSANFGTFTDPLGLGNIVNDDGAPSFTISGCTVTEPNSLTTNCTFTITRTGSTELTSTVTYSTVDQTAVAGSDFVGITNGQVTFAPGDTVKTVNVVVNGDTIYEQTETFLLRMTNVTNGTFGTPAEATGTITNNETAPRFDLVSTGCTVVEPNSGTIPCNFTITRTFLGGTTGTQDGASVNFATTDGTATSPSDYTAVNTTVVFAAGDASRTVAVLVNGDTVNEPTETFTATISAPTNGWTLGNTTATGTITNNDSPTISINSISLPEGNAGTTAFTFTVTRTGDLTLPATVNYQSFDGTAIAPVDYTPIVPGTLNFGPGVSTLTLTVFVNGDLTIEPDETFTVVLSNPTNATLGTATGVGTILNDDGMAISISGTITNFSPAGPAAGVTVVLSGSTSATTTTNASGFYTFTGLPSGGNFLVTPTAPAGTVASPTSRSYTGITASVTNANFVLYQSGAIPRTLNVVNTFAVPGSPVTVPITLTAQGDEAALSFTLNYNSAILSAPTVACGSGSPMCALVTNTGTPGVITVSVEAQDGAGLPTTYAAGTRVVINVTFNTSATSAVNTPITFSNTPTPLRTSDSASNPLPTVYNNGFVFFQQGLESDVAPRPSGDGTVNAPDVIQTRRFVTNLDIAGTGIGAGTNEFQRADSAPAGTKGDGVLNASDVIQARRYAATLDPTQTAGGPSAPIPPPGPAPETRVFKAGKLGDIETSVGTIIRVVNASGAPGSQVFVDIQLDHVPADRVVALQTSVFFDNTKLSISGISTPGINPDVTLGSGVPAGTSLTVNANQASAGRIGFLADSFPTLWTPGTNNQIVRLRFTIASNAPAGLTPVTLTGIPVPQSISDDNGNAVTFTNENGNVNIIVGPTAAGVTVGGRVITPAGAGLRGATVSITGADGVTRTVTTSTFGYYQFEEVEAGGNYIVAVTSRRFRFAPRTVQVIDNLSDLDFQGQE